MRRRSPSARSGGSLRRGCRNPASLTERPLYLVSANEDEDWRDDRGEGDDVENGAILRERARVSGPKPEEA